MVIISSVPDTNDTGFVLSVPGCACGRPAVKTIAAMLGNDMTLAFGLCSLHAPRSEEHAAEMIRQAEDDFCAWVARQRRSAAL